MALFGQYSFSIAFFLVVFKQTSGNNETNDPLKYVLLQHLLNPNRYDPSIPPDYIYDNATHVYVQIAIYDVSAESEQNMEYECTMYLRMNWTDKRLDYSANASYDVLKVSGSYVSKVWIPDIFFHDDRSENFLGFIGKNELVFIGRNGNMQFSGRIAMESVCRMDLGKYPYDRPRCPITIQSYAYTADDVILHWSEHNPVTTPPKFLRELQNERTESFTSPYSDAVGNFSTLKTTVELERDDGSFLELYIFPPIILVLTAWTSFFFGDAFKNITPRIAVCAAALTTVIMHWAGLYNKLRPGSGLKKLDVWMLMNLVFIFSIISANCIVYHFECKWRICKSKNTQNATKSSASQSVDVSMKDKENTCIRCRRCTSTKCQSGEENTCIRCRRCTCIKCQKDFQDEENTCIRCRRCTCTKCRSDDENTCIQCRRSTRIECQRDEDNTCIQCRRCTCINCQRDEENTCIECRRSTRIECQRCGIGPSISMNKILCLAVGVAYSLAVGVYVPSWQH